MDNRNNEFGAYVEGFVLTECCIALLGLLFLSVKGMWALIKLSWRGLRWCGHKIKLHPKHYSKYAESEVTPY